MNDELIAQEQLNGRVAYAKVPKFAHQKDRILRLANNKLALEKLPTKTRPKATSVATVTLHLSRSDIRATHVTVEDFDSFARTRRSRPAVAREAGAMRELVFKEGIKSIIGERGKFQDWGGEKSDLFTTQARLRGRRVRAAFAFKGRATQGVLTLAKLGKNANQVLRLFQSAADVFIVQYHGQVDEDVLQEMSTHAKVKSAEEGRQVWYGIINGTDTARLIAAYPVAFRVGRNRGYS